MSYRRILISSAVAICVASSAAVAQFTAVVSPPKKKETPAQVTDRTDQQKRADSITSVARMTDIKAWVDSAAGTSGVRVAPVTAADSAKVTYEAAGEITAHSSAHGATAPATATNLPLIAIAGSLLAAIGAGLVLRRHDG